MSPADAGLAAKSVEESAKCDDSWQAAFVPLCGTLKVQMSESLHILVVDDEPRIRTMLRRYLVGEGFKVTEAADGAALHAALDREAVDLVLLDLTLAGEDGLSLAREIRQRFEIIMVTSRAS